MIYAVALVLIACAVILTACNRNAGIFDVSGDGVAEPTHFIAKLMLGLNDSVQVFGWTVVAFTVILKVVLSPLDIWQKAISRRNAKAMERMRPQLEALAEKCGDDKQRYQQEQMALYKKEKYSMLGACLPSLVTLIVFIVLFAGFRQMVGYQFALDYRQSYDVFTEVYDAEMNASLAEALEAAGLESYEDLPQTAEKAEAHAAAVDKAQTAVVTGQEGIAMSRITGVMKDEYNLVMGKVLGAEDTGYGKEGKWNGLLILPVLSIALSFLSQKLLTKSQGAPPPTAKGDSAQANMKMMQVFMPIMVGVFALFYSAAFALYTFTSSLVSVLFQLIFGLVGKLLDRRDAARQGMKRA